MTLTTPQVEEIQARYDDLGSLKAVSRQLGFSPNTVKKYLRKDQECGTRHVVTELQSDDEVLIGFFVGFWMGDGTRYVDRGTYKVKFALHREQERLSGLLIRVACRLFGVKAWDVISNTRARRYVHIASKFVYEFVENHCSIRDNKTLSVRSLRDVRSLSERMRYGLLLGLMLSDGSLKSRAHFNVVSAPLARDFADLCDTFGLEAHLYVHSREHLGWNDLHMMSLRKQDSIALLHILDEALELLDAGATFQQMKYEPARI